jgi:hypothetical protein
MVRDIYLATSGLLKPKIGGPSVFPAQPAGALSGFGGFKWSTSENGDQYRRSLYTFRQRTAPFAMTSLFDAPPGVTCTVRRRRSTTPLQALAMLNDSLTIDAARALAIEISGRHGLQLDAQLTLAFQQCTSRPPDNDELRMILDFYQTQLRHLSESPDLAAALSAAGPTTDSRSPAELAAWTATTRLLLNLNDVILKQ